MGPNFQNKTIIDGTSILCESSPHFGFAQKSKPEVFASKIGNIKIPGFLNFTLLICSAWNDIFLSRFEQQWQDWIQNDR